MGFSFEKPASGPARKNESSDSDFDPERRKFILTALTAGAGYLALPKMLRALGDEKDGQEESYDPQDAEHRHASSERHAKGRNPFEHGFAFDKETNIGEAEYREAVRYWKTRYEKGDLAESFDSAVGTMRAYWDGVREAFERKGVPTEFALVSIPESFWNDKTWGTDGPFQLSKENAEHYGIKHPENPYDGARGAAALFADIGYEVGGRESFAILKYNGSFVGKFLESWHERHINRPPGIDDFYRYMSKEVNGIRHRIRREQGNTEQARTAFKEETSGMRINMEYLPKYRATVKLVREREKERAEKNRQHGNEYIAMV
ncbi:MAG: hypothetical protein WCJ25_01125 [Candidatus Moraniibacteriota bacterium]